MTHYNCDASGHVPGATRMYGTGQVVTWNYTYEPIFNQLASVTDPLSHATTYIYDTQDNVHQIQDALGHLTRICPTGRRNPSSPSQTHRPAVQDAALVRERS